MSRLDLIHDTLAAGHGCYHPKNSSVPAECERIEGLLALADLDRGPLLFQMFPVPADGLWHEVGGWVKRMPDSPDTAFADTWVAKAP